MSLKIFVTATNTDVGKTWTTLRLMEAVAQKGVRPGAFKPIETGVVNDGAPDGNALLGAMHRLNPDAKGLSLEDVVPVRYELPAAPYVARHGEAVDWAIIHAAFERVSKRCDILFIEGAGGVLVPIDETRFMADLPTLFSAKVVLVAPGGLGSINDTLLSLEALARRGHDATLLVNLREKREDFERLTRLYYDDAGIRYKLLPDDLERVAESLAGPIEGRSHRFRRH